MADIDAIFAEMQAESQPRRVARAPPSARPPRKAAAAHSKADASISQLQSVREKKSAPERKLDASLSWLETWGVQAASEKQRAPPSALPSAAGAPPPAAEEKMDVPQKHELSPATVVPLLVAPVETLRAADSPPSQKLRALEYIAQLALPADELASDVLDAALDSLTKPLLKRAQLDPADRVRERASEVLSALLAATEAVDGVLPYAWPVLCSSLVPKDLDGDITLHPEQREKPEQKPTEIKAYAEKCEEVRLQLARLAHALVLKMSASQAFSYVDDCTSCLRALCMDEWAEVKLAGMQALMDWCYRNTELLLYFAVPMGRSLHSCLVHAQQQVRITALRALTAVLFCGVWKTNHEVVSNLVAFQDPNSVPIKAFYENVTSVNYLSTITFDQHPAVRRFWFETICYWVLRVPDRVDHEPHLFPYLLSGLCDADYSIAVEVFWLMERLGVAYEEEHEKDLRETKQSGLDEEWTYNGRARVPFALQARWDESHSVEQRLAVELVTSAPKAYSRAAELAPAEVTRAAEVAAALGDELPPPPQRAYSWAEFDNLRLRKTLPRPRLGARQYVRTHVRRFIKALFNDVTAFQQCNALNAAKLLAICISYIEDNVQEWLQATVASLSKFYADRAHTRADETEVRNANDVVCKLLGAYLAPEVLFEQLEDALYSRNGEPAPVRTANVLMLAHMISGASEALNSVVGVVAEKLVAEDAALEVAAARQKGCEERATIGLGRWAATIDRITELLTESDLTEDVTPPLREALWALLRSIAKGFAPYLTSTHIRALASAALCLAAALEEDGSASVVEKGEEQLFELLQLLELEEPKTYLSTIVADLAGDATLPQLRALLALCDVDVLAPHRVALSEALVAYSSPGQPATRRVGALRAAADVATRAMKRAAELELESEVENRSKVVILDDLDDIDLDETRSTKVAIAEQLRRLASAVVRPTFVTALAAVQRTRSRKKYDCAPFLDYSAATEMLKILRSIATHTFYDGAALWDSSLVDEGTDVCWLDEEDDDFSDVERELEEREKEKLALAQARLEIEQQAAAERAAEAQAQRALEDEAAQESDGARTGKKPSEGQPPRRSQLTEDDPGAEQQKEAINPASRPEQPTRPRLEPLAAPTSLIDALVQICVDHELNKKYHCALEEEHRMRLNKSRDEDIAVMDNKRLRETAFEQSVKLRCLAADVAVTLLAGKAGASYARLRARELRRVLLAAQQMLSTKAATATIMPLSIRPAHPGVTLSGFALCDALFRVACSAPVMAYTLVETAPQLCGTIARSTVRDRPSVKQLTFVLSKEEAATVGYRAAKALVDLNLPLPADPSMPPIPSATAGGVRWGERSVALDGTALLAQPEELVQWNAALAGYNYALGLLDSGLKTGLGDLAGRWEKNGRLGRALIVKDLIKRSL